MRIVDSDPSLRCRRGDTDEPAEPNTTPNDLDCTIMTAPIDTSTDHDADSTGTDTHTDTGPCEKTDRTGNLDRIET